MLVDFKDQPELGIWWMDAYVDADHVRIYVTDNTPAGLKELAHHATISVRRSLLRRHRPQQKETLF